MFMAVLKSTDTERGMVALKKTEQWKHSLITGVAGFVIFEIIVLWMQFQGLLGNVATGILNIILLPVQIGSIAMLGLNLIIILCEIPYFQRKVRLLERTKQFIIILVAVIQLLIITSLFLLSTESFCRMLSFSSDMYTYDVLHYSRQAFILLLPTTITAVVIGFFLQKATFSTSLLSVVCIGFVGFIAINLTTGMFGMPRLGDAMIVMVQPFAFLMPAIRMDMFIPEKKRSGDKKMNTEKSKIIAALLAFFVGGIGVHRYYLGYTKAGAIQTCGFVSLIIGFSLYSASIYESGILVLLSLVFLLLGLATEIWVFVDFVRILTGSLVPADGTAYTESSPKQVNIVNPAPSVNDNADALEKLAALHKQGVLTDEEFQKKKADILERM